MDRAACEAACPGDGGGSGGGGSGSSSARNARRHHPEMDDPSAGAAPEAYGFGTSNAAGETTMSPE